MEKLTFILLKRMSDDCSQPWKNQTFSFISSGPEKFLDYFIVKYQIFYWEIQLGVATQFSPKVCLATSPLTFHFDCPIFKPYLFTFLSHQIAAKFCLCRSPFIFLNMVHKMWFFTHIACDIRRRRLHFSICLWREKQFLYYFPWLLFKIKHQNIEQYHHDSH